jgi:hypothetical protein
MERHGRTSTLGFRSGFMPSCLRRGMWRCTS